MLIWLICFSMRHPHRSKSDLKVWGIALFVTFRRIVQSCMFFAVHTVSVYKTVNSRHPRGVSWRTDNTLVKSGHVCTSPGKLQPVGVMTRGWVAKGEEGWISPNLRNPHVHWRWDWHLCFFQPLLHYSSSFFTLLLPTFPSIVSFLTSKQQKLS